MSETNIAGSSQRSTKIDPTKQHAKIFCNIFDEIIHNDFKCVSKYQVCKVARKEISINTFLETIVVEEPLFKQHESLDINTLKSERAGKYILNHLIEMVNDFEYQFEDPQELAKLLLTMYQCEHLITLSAAKCGNLLGFTDFCNVAESTIAKNYDRFQSCLKNYAEANKFLNNLEILLNESFFTSDILKAVNVNKNVYESKDFLTDFTQVLENTSSSFDSFIKEYQTLNVEIEFLKTELQSIFSKFSSPNYEYKSEELKVTTKNLKVSEILNELQNFKGNVTIEALYVVHVDTDFLNEYWHGRNLCIITPKIVVHGNRQWNLSGLNGANHDQNRADTDENENGINGKNGNNGKNSGNVCFLNVKEIIDGQKLTILLNGGNGGNGQNGGDGKIKETCNFSKMNWNDFMSKFFLHEEGEKRITEILDNINQEFPITLISWEFGSSNSLNILRKPEKFVHRKNTLGEEFFFSYYIDAIIPSAKYKCYALYKCQRGNCGYPGKGGSGGFGGKSGSFESHLEQNAFTVSNASGEKGIDGEKGRYPELKNNLDFGYIYSGKKKVTEHGKTRSRYLDISSSKTKIANSIKCRYRKRNNVTDYFITFSDIAEINTTETDQIEDTTKNIDVRNVCNSVHTGYTDLLCNESSSIKTNVKFRLRLNSKLSFNQFPSPAEVHDIKLKKEKAEEDFNSIYNRYERKPMREVLLKFIDLQNNSFNSVKDFRRFESIWINVISKLPHDRQPALDKDISITCSNSKIFKKYFITNIPSEIFIERNLPYFNLNCYLYENGLIMVPIEIVASQILHNPKNVCDKNFVELARVFFVFIYPSFQVEVNSVKDTSKFNFAELTIKSLEQNYVSKMISEYGDFHDTSIKVIDQEKLDKIFINEETIKVQVDGDKYIYKKKKLGLVKLMRHLVLFHLILKKIERELWGDSNKYLRCNQLFTIFFAVFETKNVFYEFPSGEGKSIVILCSSIIRALFFNETIHIVSSSHLLAERDVENYGHVYKKLGVSVAHNNKEIKQNRKEVYHNNNVVYGTLRLFQYDYLLDYFYGEGNFGSKIAETVFIDEVDNVLIDNGDNVLYLPKQMPQFDKLNEVFRRIWLFIQKYKPSEVLQLVKVSLASEQTDVELLSEITDLQFALDNKITIPIFLQNFVDLNLKAWIDSASMAIRLQENYNYVIDNHGTRLKQDQSSDIIIISQDTGTDQVGAEWDEGLHQFLQLKHELPHSVLNLKSVFISNLTYTAKYKNIFGFTGTLGTKEEQDFFDNIFDVSFLRVGSFGTQSLIMLDPLLCDDTEIWKTKILDSTKEKFFDENRPVVIFCGSINDVDMLYQYFKDNLGDCDIEQIKRDKDCRPIYLKEKTIILSTNLNGRGSDIKVSEDMEKQGGLHVCLTFFASTLRVEQQAFNRAARNEQTGTGQLILKNDFQVPSDQISIIEKERVLRDLIRLERDKRNYYDITKREEECLELFRKGMKELKQCFKLDYVLEDYCMNKWALKLHEIRINMQEMSKNGDVILDVKKEMEDFISSLKSSIDNLKLYRFDKCGFDLQCFVRLALQNAKDNKIDRALEILDYIIQKEPDFSGAAQYYKFCIYSQKVDWASSSFALSNEFKLLTTAAQYAIIALRKERDVQFKIRESTDFPEDIDESFLQKVNKICVLMALEQSIVTILNPINRNLFNLVDSKFVDKVLEKIEISSFNGNLVYYKVCNDWKKKLKNDDCSQEDFDKINDIIKSNVCFPNKLGHFKPTLGKLSIFEDIDNDAYLSRNGFDEFLKFDYEIGNFLFCLGWVLFLVPLGSKANKVYENISPISITINIFGILASMMDVKKMGNRDKNFEQLLKKLVPIRKFLNKRMLCEKAQLFLNRLDSFSKFSKKENIKTILSLFENLSVSDNENYAQTIKELHIISDELTVDVTTSI